MSLLTRVICFQVGKVSLRVDFFIKTLFDDTPPPITASTQPGGSKEESGCVILPSSALE